MVQRYYYLRPGAFNLQGFAYGRTDGGVTQVAVTVRLVRSGRWAEQEERATELRQDELTHREVSEEEALNGVGTVVWSTICTANARSDGTRVWMYGLVLGYRWVPDHHQGWVDVDFGGSRATIEYNQSSTRDVPVEVYALQPCQGKSTSLVMSAEVKQAHVEVYNRFHGINQTATRDSKVLLALNDTDESRTVPLMNSTTAKMSFVPVRHILDYVYYKEGGRPHPSGKTFGESIFANTEITSSVLEPPKHEPPKPAMNSYPVQQSPPRTDKPSKETELFVYERWENGLSDCCAHTVPNGFMVTLCPCVSLAQIWARLGIKRYWVALLIHLVLYGIYWIGTLAKVNRAALVSLIIAGNIYTARKSTRERYRIPGNAFEDCMISCCCGCCAMAQIATHIKSYRPGSCDFGARDTLPPYPSGSQIHPSG